MREIDPDTAAAYLRETGRVPIGMKVNARALGWGVSNVVIRVDFEGRDEAGNRSEKPPPLILKQARERLRTRALWVSRLERIWTEHAALICLAPLLPPGAVPEVVFEDRDNYLFAMTAAPEPNVVWKERLLAVRSTAEVMAEHANTGDAARLLARIHATTFDHSALHDGGLLSDRTVFDQLRIDPFYRTVAAVHPDLRAALEPLMDLPTSSELDHLCFVHGDFSPKNLLVHPTGASLTLVDFETAHAGDPAYDLGFVLSHLLLKGVHAARRFAADGKNQGTPDAALSLATTFLDTYRQAASSFPIRLDALDRRAAAHAAANALARIDGKSPVDYLDPPAQEAVRRFARKVLLTPEPTCLDLPELLAQEMRAIT